MNARRDPDRLINAFLMEGQTELADPVFDAVRTTIEHKRQRVVIGPWRMPNAMNKFVSIGLGTAAVVGALIVGMQFLPTAPGGVGAGPSATPSPTAAPSPTSAPSPSTAQPSAASGLPEGPFRVIDAQGPQAVPITVTIPAPGWSSDPGFGALQKGDDADPPEAALLAWTWPAGTPFYVYGDPCRWASTAPTTPATTVDAIAAALATQASRNASTPLDVTVGGRNGKMITLHVPDDAATRADAFASCDEGNFASYAGGDPGHPSRYHQGPGQIDELWILDVGGAFVIIDAMYRPDTPAALVDELRAIAESATFALD